MGASSAPLSFQFFVTLLFLVEDKEESLKEQRKREPGPWGPFCPPSSMKEEDKEDRRTRAREKETVERYVEEGWTGGQDPNFFSKIRDPPPRSTFFVSFNIFFLWAYGPQPFLSLLYCYLGPFFSLSLMPRAPSNRKEQKRKTKKGWGPKARKGKLIISCLVSQFFSFERTRQEIQLFFLIFGLFLFILCPSSSLHEEKGQRIKKRKDKRYKR